MDIKGDSYYLENIPAKDRKRFQKIKKHNLIIANDILVKNNVTFWIADGTLLGIYREGDFILWDNEIDLDVFIENLFPKIDSLKEDFLKAGFMVDVSKDLNNTKINLFRNMSKVSIRGLYLCPEYENNKYRLSKGYRYPKSFYDVFGKIEFKGNSYKTPNPIKDYLNYVYGKGWKISVRYKKHLYSDWKNRGVKLTKEDRNIINNLIG